MYPVLQCVKESTVVGADPRVLTLQPFWVCLFQALVHCWANCNRRQCSCSLIAVANVMSCPLWLQWWMSCLLSALFSFPKFVAWESVLTIERLAGCIRSLCILESSTALYILDVYNAYVCIFCRLWFWVWSWYQSSLQPGKMGSRVKEDEKNEMIIRRLLKLPENKRCINCGSQVNLETCTFLLGFQSGFDGLCPFDKTAWVCWHKIMWDFSGASICLYKFFHICLHTMQWSAVSGKPLHLKVVYSVSSLPKISGFASRRACVLNQMVKNPTMAGTRLNSLGWE